MNLTIQNESYQSHASSDSFDDQDTITLQCRFAGRSQKAMWLICPDGKTRAFAFSQTHIMSGEQRQGASITVQVKGWMYRQAFVKGEQRQTPAATQPAQAALPAPVATGAANIGAYEVIKQCFALPCNAGLSVLYWQHKVVLRIANERRKA